MYLQLAGVIPKDVARRISPHDRIQHRHMTAGELDAAQVISNGAVGKHGIAVATQNDSAGGLGGTVADNQAMRKGRIAALAVDGTAWTGLPLANHKAGHLHIGIGVIMEVIRRLVMGSEPVSVLMIVTGIIACGANVTCLILLAKHRSGEVHMRASWIFSTNDVIANAGVVLSGLLVMWLGSRIPDLVIGAVVSVVVIRGGSLILQEARRPRE